MIVTSVQIKTAKTQKHLYCPVFTMKKTSRWLVFFGSIINMVFIRFYNKCWGQVKIRYNKLRKLKRAKKET